MIRLTHRVAALGLCAGLSACTAQRPNEHVDVERSAQALSRAAGLQVTPQACGPDGGPPDSGFDNSTLEDFPEGSSSGDGGTQTLAQYTEECEQAVHFLLPDKLDCELGSEVPGQARSCDLENNIWGCDRPNVLNSACDPGSKFQRLMPKPSDDPTANDPNAAAVMHCRSKGSAPGLYDDIAIIMANATTGATCFFQALTDDMPGQNIPSPKQGEAAWHWYSPEDTARTGCTSCHDNGSFIRSSYIAQMPTMPNADEGFGNTGKDLYWVGKAFEDKHSWSVKLANPPCISGSGPDCLSCTSCHVLAVNDYEKDSPVEPDYQGVFWAENRGTALDFGLRATAEYQASKHVHSAASPIWMIPDQDTFSEVAHQAAQAFAKCGAEFVNAKFDMSVPLSEGCSVQPLGKPWKDRPMQE